MESAVAELTRIEEMEGAREGKYLTFNLADESYGLEILKVREIIGIMEITAVPRTPIYIKGVINLRGRVIPVVDLRLKFAMPSSEYTEETCIIVVDVTGTQTGIIVDNVDEVLDISETDIEDSPDFGTGVDTDYILGVGKIGGGVKILLDIEKVLTAKDMDIITQAANEITAATENEVEATAEESTDEAPEEESQAEEESEEEQGQ